MNILGINCYAHDSAAALIVDDKLEFAVAEERLSRRKKDRSFPHRAIRQVLEEASLDIAQLDAVAFSWNRPGAAQVHTIKSAIEGKIPRSRYFTIDQLWFLFNELYRGNGDKQFAKMFDASDLTSFYIDHHESHAWSSYALSGFDDATVVVIDGRGSTQATTIYSGNRGSLKLLKRKAWPDSLGTFYQSFTDLLGFRRMSDEWKVMGLAAYGEPNIDLDGIIKTYADGYSIATRRICGADFSDLSPLIKVFGPRRTPDVSISKDDMDLAASVQRKTEQAISRIVEYGIKLSGSRNVCLAGGVALNSKANGVLSASGLVENLFVQPAASDDGTAVGAALGAYKKLGRNMPRSKTHHVFLGPKYDHDHVEELLSSIGVPFLEVHDVSRVGARLLEQGNILGWFQGRMEFGPRSLGNRSILADPRNVSMRNKVNESVKLRETWRPFAPSCLEEFLEDYFDGTKDMAFMTTTVKIKPGREVEIPAVTHVDGTARIQSVNEATNPLFYSLIRAFYDLTRVPVLLNTSFNLNDEPIVCTPRDAVRTYFASGLDYLIIDKFLVSKQSLNESLQF